MKHKALNLIRIAPFAALVLAFSLSANAAYDRDEEIDRSDREMTSVSDLLPEVQNLNCQPKCDGQPACGQLKTLDSCLDNSQTNGCFWSCE